MRRLTTPYDVVGITRPCTPDDVLRRRTTTYDAVRSRETSCDVARRSMVIRRRKTSCDVVRHRRVIHIGQAFLSTLQALFSSREAFWLKSHSGRSSPGVVRRRTDVRDAGRREVGRVRVASRGVRRAASFDDV